MKITKAEFWILNKAADCGLYMGLIFPDRAGFYFSTYHGLDSAGLIDALTNLFDAGYLIAIDDADWNSTEFVPDRSTVARAVNIGLPVLCYSLTAKGGEAWEKLACPDWSRFVTSDFPEDDGIYVLRGGSQEAIDEYIKLSVERSVEVEMPFDVVEMSRAMVSPWEAAYWKTLDRGFERHVKASEPDMEPAWYVSLVMNWHTIPRRFLPFDKSPAVDWNQFTGDNEVDVIMTIIEEE